MVPLLGWWSMSSLAAAFAEALADGGWRSKARANQLPPDGEWLIWLILAGRGFGKTRAGAEWVQDIAEDGPPKRIALVGATAADVRDTMIEGESGILAIAPR
jgi:phage terminase large subunit-like protein